MTLLPVFQWLGGSAAGLFMRKSTWGFAITETIHLLGLATLGGVVLVISLSGLGWGLARTPRVRLIRALAPIFWTSLTVMLVSGFLLLVSKPVRYYLDDIFRVKMMLLALAVIAFVIYQRRSLSDVEVSSQTWIARASTGLFLALWLGVALAGRFIGFL